ncbi:hypothetical protein STEG23_000093, partial [Scotinomys teguina]
LQEQWAPVGHFTPVEEPPISDQQPPAEACCQSQAAALYAFLQKLVVHGETVLQVALPPCSTVQQLGVSADRPYGS